MPREQRPVTQVFRLASGDIKITCARCGKRMIAAPEDTGRRLLCLRCRLPFVVPDATGLGDRPPATCERLEWSDRPAPGTQTERLLSLGPDGLPRLLDASRDIPSGPFAPFLDLAELAPGTDERRNEDAGAVGTEPQVTFQDFEVVDRIGGGGMGAVYKVRRDGQSYALKLLDPALANEDAYLRRFEQEASLLRSVQHDNLVRVHESGVHEGRPYILMEYCNGPNLRQVVKRYGPLNWAQAAAVIASVARGLSAALEAGLIHRDVKPDNILLVRHGDEVTVKLVDFGLIKQIGRQKIETGQFSLAEQDWLKTVDEFARSIRRILKGRDRHVTWRQRVDRILARVRRQFARQKPLRIDPEVRRNFRYLRQITDDNRSLGLTLTGECFGTPKFMAPEMWLDVPGDHRADIFALGITWYWLVCKKYPFEGPHVHATMDKILGDPPVALSRWLGVISSGAESMIYAMINKLPDQRYPTYDRLIADCEAILAGETPVVDFFGETIGLYEEPEPGDEAEYVTGLMARFIQSVSVKHSPAARRTVDDIG